MSVKARIIRIGNSQGIRIPSSLLALSNLPEEVEIDAEPGRLIIQASRVPRAGWEEAAQRMHAEGLDVLLDPPTATDFDRTQWEW